MDDLQTIMVIIWIYFPIEIKDFKQARGKMVPILLSFYSA